MFTDFIFGKYKSGIIQLITLGGIGVWSVVDLIMIANQNFTDDKENKIKNDNKKHLIIGIIICVIVIIIEMFTLISGFMQIKNLSWPKGYENAFKDYRIQVFMEYDAEQQEIDMLKKRLIQTDGVKTIDFRSKEDAYNEMKEKLGESSENLNFNSEIFSVSYIITTDNPNLINKIEKIEGVKSVTDNFKTIQVSENVNEYTKILKYTVLISIIYRIIYITGITFVCFVIIDKKKHIA